MAKNVTFNCLCGLPSKCSTSKSGETWYRCGKEIDYKTERQKQPALQDLGCNLRMNEDMITEFHMSVDPYNFKKCTPKCSYHKLFGRLFRVNDPEKESYGNWYYVCNAQAPDAACNFFTWFDDDESSETSGGDEQQQQQQQRPTKKFKKMSNGKRNSFTAKRKFVKKSR